LTLLATSASAFVLKLGFTDGKPTRLQALLTFSGLRRVGRYSYGMYVYHVPILMLSEMFVYSRVPTNIRSSPIFACFFVGALSILTFFTAMVSFESLEKRILSLKKYFRPSFVEPARANAAAKL
jgi:peptidoglycan/LPS O-acetylase OafA/YrhL